MVWMVRFVSLNLDDLCSVCVVKLICENYRHAMSSFPLKRTRGVQSGNGLRVSKDIGSQTETWHQSYGRSTVGPSNFLSYDKLCSSIL